MLLAASHEYPERRVKVPQQSSNVLDAGYNKSNRTYVHCSLLVYKIGC